MDVGIEVAEGIGAIVAVGTMVGEGAAVGSGEGVGMLVAVGPTVGNAVGVLLSAVHAATATHTNSTNSATCASFREDRR